MSQEPRTLRSPRPTRLGIADYLLMALLSLSLIAYCLKLSHNRLLWADESLGREIVTAPTLSSMWRAWREGVDGGGIFYYILGRSWIKIVGFSELNLRLFSTFGTVAAFLITWITARRYFSIFAVTIGTSVVYLTSPTILWQDVNGRFYGMFLAATALACAVFVRNAEKDRSDTSDLLLIAFSQALLIGTHVLGMIYAASFFLVMVFFDRLYHRWKPRLYLAALAGWIMLPVSYRAIVNTSSVAKTGFWATAPSFRSLPFTLFKFNHFVSRWFFCLILYVVIASLLKLRSRPYALFMEYLRVNTWLFLVGALVLSQLILFAKSRVGTSIYADRYLMPVQIGTVFLLAALVTRAWQLAPWLWPTRRLAPLASVLVILFYFKYALATTPYAEIYPKPGEPQSIEDLLPPNHTVVTTSIGTFLLMRVYDTSHHYIYPMDWAFDLAPTHASYNLSGQILMENWRRGSLVPEDILDCQDIFNRLPDFTLAAEPGGNPWIQERILHNPSLRTQLVHSPDDASGSSLFIWNVHRITSPASCR